MKLFSKIGRTLKEYKRVIKISKKPNKKEFTSILKITSLGLTLIGMIGFAIQLIYQFIIKVIIR